MKTFHLKAYYNSTVEPPKTAGEMAMHVELLSEHSMRMELEIFQARKDIGKIEGCICEGGKCSQWKEIK